MYVNDPHTDPAEAIDAILAAPHATQPLRIAEIGAGTGIATRELLAAGERHGGIARLDAFDPSEGMLQHLRRSLFGTPDAPGVVATLQARGALAANAQVRVAEGAFDTFEAGHDNDLVVIAQAWHWCPNFDQALAHIAQALRPGGVLALLWNLEDREAAPWVAQLRDLYEPYEDGVPQYRHMAWKQMLDTPSYARSFEALPPVQQQRELPTTLDGAVDRMLSKSYISVLPEEERARLAAQARAVFDAPDSTTGRKWLDASAGVFAYPYRTGMKRVVSY